jgi:hypothetical protein
LDHAILLEVRSPDKPDMCDNKIIFMPNSEKMIFNLLIVRKYMISDKEMQASLDGRK